MQPRDVGDLGVGLIPVYVSRDSSDQHTPQQQAHIEKSGAAREHAGGHREIRRAVHRGEELGAVRLEYARPSNLNWLRSFEWWQPHVSSKCVF